MNNILFSDLHILETKLFIAMQDWEVPIVGFFILSPKRKVRSIDAFTQQESIEFMHIVQRIRKVMRDELHIQDVYLFQNEDTAHNFHLWMFPRHQWMEQFGRKIQSVRPIMEYAKANMTDEKTLQEVRQAAQKAAHVLSNE